ncbi:neuropeptide Y receptor type 6-like [Stylophora pistillata]|uniref:neuropeptide Y receptor type 6-like n=1 Tax=Stylophora pistillata TaxID=50429 RepID=UPI000C04790B|nr:neuropeptide Y receptor type 6-like [Stylophora pistillata]
MVLDSNATNLALFGNSTNSSESHRFAPWPMFETARMIILALQIVVFLVGTVGNVLVCIIASRKRNLKIVGNRFILNLALADLGVLFISFPMWISKEFGISWPFGEFLCKTFQPFTDIFYGVGIGCITAIALHRYRMLVHCMKPQMNVQKAKRVLFFIWLLSFFIVVMPLFFVMELRKKPFTGKQYCEPSWPTKLAQQMYHTTIAISFYFAPLVIISLTYIRIRTKLKDSIRKHDSYRRSSFKADETMSRKETASRIMQNRRALRLLAPVVVVFAVCMAPFIFLHLVASFIRIKGSIHTAIAFRFFALLLVTNASANPIIYSVMNSDFRRDFKQLLRCNTDGCCTDTTEGLSLATFRRSSSSFGRRSAKERKRSSFLIERRRNSFSSLKKSSRNSCEKLQAKTNGGLTEGKHNKRVDG